MPNYSYIEPLVPVVVTLIICVFFYCTFELFEDSIREQLSPPRTILNEGQPLTIHGDIYLVLDEDRENIESILHIDEELDRVK